MNKLYLALVCLMVTAFAVSTSVDANYRRGRGRCANGRCERKEKSCRTGSCREKSCAVCPSCPKEVIQQPRETFCVTEEFCEPYESVKVVPETRYRKVRCVTNVEKKCCVTKGEECVPGEETSMKPVSEAPAYVHKALEKSATK